MSNPYRYGAPVSGEQFTGRHAELRAVADRMRDGINVLIMSPRRYGKTSLIERAAARVGREGAAAVYVSAIGVADRAGFATNLLAALYRVKGGRWHRGRQAVPEFLSRIRLKPTVSFEGAIPSFSIEPSLSASDLTGVIADVYAALADLRTPARPVVLIVDEFQEVLGIDEHLPAQFKALADQHPQVSLVIAGSKRHVMQQLVLDRAAPLYGMTTTLTLGPIPADEMADFLVRRANAGGKELLVALADRMVALAGPVPNDIQYLAYEVYATGGERITERDVETGLRMAVEHGADLHATRFDRMSSTQRRVAKHLAVTGGTTQPYSAEFRRATQIGSPGTLRNALAPLIEDEIITESEGAYRLTDPFFASWLGSRP